MDGHNSHMISPIYCDIGHVYRYRYKTRLQKMPSKKVSFGRGRILNFNRTKAAMADEIYKDISAEATSVILDAFIKGADMSKAYARTHLHKCRNRQ